MDPNQSKGKSIEERLSAYHGEEAPHEAEVKEKLPEPVPSSEPKPTEEVKVEPTVEKPEEDLALPENASERTREQFEKLKSRLREKEEALRAKETQAQPEINPADYGNSVFDSFHPQPQAPQVPQAPVVNTPYLNPLQRENIVNQFIDQQGNVDVNGLNQALNASNQRAQEATRRVQSVEEKLARFEEDQQVREAHSQHPELDPLKRDKFDPKLFDLVRDRLLRNMYEGKKQSLLEVTNSIKALYKPTPRVDEAKIKEEAVAQYKQTQAARNQGPIEQGRGEGRVEAPELQELRARTRRKGPDSDVALTERLKRIGI